MPRIFVNRKTDFSPKDFAFFHIFSVNVQNQCIIALGLYLWPQIVELGL